MNLTKTIGKDNTQSVVQWLNKESDEYIASCDKSNRSGYCCDAIVQYLAMLILVLEVEVETNDE